jgi:hypothetical protein
MGCRLSELPEPLYGPHGAHRVRFLSSPDSDDFVSLSDLADDEILPPSEVENWERRLGIVIPKGGGH